MGLVRHEVVEVQTSGYVGGSKFGSRFDRLCVVGDSRPTEELVGDPAEESPRFRATRELLREHVAELFVSLRAPGSGHRPHVPNELPLERFELRVYQG